MSKFTLMAILIFHGNISANEIVEIPDEELARESVMPVFDVPDVVKNRNVPLTKRFELGGFLGTNVNEAFYDQILYGAHGTYHFTETSGIQVLFSMISANSSQYVPQLNQVSQPPLHYDRLPKPNYFLLASYEFTPFYGKISVTKQSTINLTTYATLGGGVFSLGDETTPLVGVGIGQNFFVGSGWGVKLDMKGLIYSGIEPISVDLNQVQGTPSVSQYERQTVVNFTVSIGALFLL